MNLGELARKHRIKKGMTQLELSQKLGYNTMQFVSLMERGVSKMPINIIGKLIVILGMPEKKIIDALVGEYSKKVNDEIKLGKNSLN